MRMDNDKDYMGIEGMMEDDDYGIILGKDGSLKGLYIPGGAEEDDVPDAILHIIKTYWNIDASDNSNYGTIH